MTILIITRSDDNPSVLGVTAELQARGHRVFRFDTDRFPAEVRLALRHDQQGDRARLVDTASGEEVEQAELTAVWYRRFAVAERLPEMDPKLRQPTLLESRATLLGWFAALPCFCLDPVEHVRHASHKSWQLRVAREVGLTVPATLTTNDPAEVRRFASEQGGHLITKMLSSFAVYDEQGQELVVFTNRLGPEQLADLEGLELCPMTFQEEVPRTLELRATIVGNQVFCAAVDPGIMQGAQVDWRRSGLELIDQWTPYTLPAEVEAGLLRLTRRLGLNYGAADLIVRPDGGHVFLEINPAGEFFWLDQILPISRNLAAVLAGEGRMDPIAS